MGLFSSKCANPDCDARVKNAAHFCPKCGYAGANSLAQCPECRKKVGRATQFCWNCGADITAMKPPRLKGHFWVRDEAEFAVRVEAGDLKGFLKRQVGIEPGTIGIVEKSGEIVKTVEHGTHTLDSLFSLTKATSVILASANGAVLRPRLAGLRDARGAELDVTLQVVLQLKDPKAFVAKHFEGHRRRLTLAMLEQSIHLELRDVGRALLTANSIEDMYGNLEWRDAFEEKIRAAMTVTLDRSGLELLQLNFVEFGGDHYEELMQQRGEVYMGNRAADHLGEQTAIRRRVLEIESQGKLDKYETAIQLRDRVDELNSQYGVKSVLRKSERLQVIEQAQHELEIKRRLWAFELDDLDTERARQVADEERAHLMAAQRATDEYEAERRKFLLLARHEELATDGDFVREQEKLSNAHVLEEAWKQSEHQRREKRAGAVQQYELLIQEAQASLEASKFRQEERLGDLDVKAREHEVEHDRQKAQVDLLARVQEEERETLRVMQSLDREKQQLEADTTRFRIEKEAEVKLAEATANKDAAVSEAAMRQMEQRLEDQKRSVDTARADSDRRAQDMKEMAGMFAGGQKPTVVVAGSGEGRVVSGAIGSGAAQSREAPCPKCQRPVPIEASYCPWCRHDMKS